MYKGYDYTLVYSTSEHNNNNSITSHIFKSERYNKILTKKQINVAQSFLKINSS